MRGFGQDLEEVTITSMLFRKTDSVELYGELCFSTEKSCTLISHGEFCLVFDSEERTGFYVDGDADAGKNFGYDEFRTEEYGEIHYIVIPDSWENEDEWIENLSNYGWVLTETKFKNKTGIEIDFNF